MSPGKATIIWQQISAGVKMRIGARNPLGDEEEGNLDFRVGPDRGNRRYRVTIRLEPSDTYTVKLHCRDLATEQVEELESADDIYCDELDELLLGWEGKHLVS